MSEVKISSMPTVADSRVCDADLTVAAVFCVYTLQFLLLLQHFVGAVLKLR